MPSRLSKRTGPPEEGSTEVLALAIGDGVSPVRTVRGSGEQPAALTATAEVGGTHTEMRVWDPGRNGTCWAHAGHTLGTCWACGFARFPSWGGGVLGASGPVGICGENRKRVH